MRVEEEPRVAFWLRDFSLAIAVGLVVGHLLFRVAGGPKPEVDAPYDFGLPPSGEGSGSGLGPGMEDNNNKESAPGILRFTLGMDLPQRRCFSFSGAGKLRGAASLQVLEDASWVWSQLTVVDGQKNRRRILVQAFGADAQGLWHSETMLALKRNLAPLSVPPTVQAMLQDSQAMPVMPLWWSSKISQLQSLEQKAKTLDPVSRRALQNSLLSWRKGLAQNARIRALKRGRVMDRDCVWRQEAGIRACVELLTGIPLWVEHSGYRLRAVDCIRPRPEYADAVMPLELESWLSTAKRHYTPWSELASDELSLLPGVSTAEGLLQGSSLDWSILHIPESLSWEDNKARYPSCADPG